MTCTLRWILEQDKTKLFLTRFSIAMTQVLGVMLSPANQDLILKLRGDQLEILQQVHSEHRPHWMASMDNNLEKIVAVLNIYYQKIIKILEKSQQTKLHENLQLSYDYFILLVANQTNIRISGTKIYEVLMRFMRNQESILKFYQSPAGFPAVKEEQVPDLEKQVYLQSEFLKSCLQKYVGHLSEIQK